MYAVKRIRLVALALLALSCAAFAQDKAPEFARVDHDLGAPGTAVVVGALHHAVGTGRVHRQEIVGRQALFVVNMEPRKMAGEVSEGMLFDLGHADGIQPALATPERPVPDGTRAG